MVAELQWWRFWPILFVTNNKKTLALGFPRIIISTEVDVIFTCKLLHFFEHDGHCLATRSNQDDIISETGDPHEQPRYMSTDTQFPESLD